VLIEHDGAYSISFNGSDLIHSRASAMQKMLGTLGVGRLNKESEARVLVGGLGLGYTLRYALQSLGPEAAVEMVEIFPAVIEWYREHLKELNGPLLDDPRVEVLEADVTQRILNAKPATYDAILLDTDNSPIPMLSKTNKSLYSYMGVRAIKAALKPDGRVVFWSDGKNDKFEGRLKKAGFKVKGVPAKAHERAKRDVYVLYVGDLRP
jgi:spermidine synthase